MTTIGGRTLLAAYSLLIPHGEQARLNLKDYGWLIEMVISFEDNESEDSAIKPNIRDSQSIELKFVNWKSSLGTSLKSPSTLATRTEGNASLQFLALNYRIGNVNKLDIQFLEQKVTK